MELINFRVQGYKCLKDTGSIRLFDDLTVLTGENDAGKSSFIRAITGLNKKITETKIQCPKQIGYVPQDSLLVPLMTVQENLMLSPFANRIELEIIAKKLSIDHLLLRFPRMLSGGEKQRVSIGRAMLSAPQLLILDEPFAALDDEMSDKISHFIKEWIEDKKIDLILVCHDLSICHFLCEEIWTINSASRLVVSSI